MAERMNMFRTIYGSLVLLLILLHLVTSFEYNGYCSRMCMWGRGGNLCKCNAVHFAGKRTMETAPTETNVDLENGPPEDLSEYRLNELLREFYKVRGQPGMDAGATEYDENEADAGAAAFPEGSGGTRYPYGFPQNFGDRSNQLQQHQPDASQIFRSAGQAKQRDRGYPKRRFTRW